MGPLFSCDSCVQKKVIKSNLHIRQRGAYIYFKFVVVASISNRNPRSLSCATHELQPNMADFEIDTNTSGLTCRNDRGGLRGGLKNTIGSLSVENSHVTLTIRSKNAVKSGRFNSPRINLRTVSSCDKRCGCGSRINCDGVCPKLFIIPASDKIVT